MIKIALVGQVLAASSIVSKSSAVSEITIAFGFIRLFFSTTKTLGASVSQLPNAKQSDGSTIMRYLLSKKVLSFSTDASSFSGFNLFSKFVSTLLW